MDVINEKSKENTKMLEKIKEIIAESLGTEISTLTEETSFKEDLGADSLDLFEMVMAASAEFREHRHYHAISRSGNSHPQATGRYLCGGHRP